MRDAGEERYWHCYAGNDKDGAADSEVSTSYSQWEVAWLDGACGWYVGAEEEETSHGQGDQTPEDDERCEHDTTVDTRLGAEDAVSRSVAAPGRSVDAAVVVVVVTVVINVPSS